MGHALQAGSLEARVAAHFSDSAKLKLEAAALSAPIANDCSYDQVFENQLCAARELGLRSVALTGNGGGRMAAALGDDDVQVCVPHTRTMRIQEVHLLALHCLCDGIDSLLIGDRK